MTKIAALGIAAALLLAGCAPARSTAAATSPDDDAVAELQTTLTDAVTLAKEYGRRHLGHYLELNGNGLAASGLAVPEGVELEVFVDHLEVCIAGTATELAADDEWRTATVTSDDDEPVAGGVCAGDALRRFRIRP